MSVAVREVDILGESHVESLVRAVLTQVPVPSPVTAVQRRVVAAVSKVITAVVVVVNYNGSTLATASPLYVVDTVAVSAASAISYRITEVPLAVVGHGYSVMAADTQRPVPLMKRCHNPVRKMCPTA